MFRTWTFLVGLLNLVAVVPHASADNTAPKEEEQLTNTTETVLRTIFLGDLRKTQSYLQELAGAYENFLEVLNDYYCRSEFEDPDVIQACIDAPKNEAEQVKEGTWTRDFQLHSAQFNNKIDGKNVGTYDFVKAVKQIGKYSCQFNLQISAVLFYRPFTITREFDFDCEITPRKLSKYQGPIAPNWWTLILQPH